MSASIQYAVALELDFPKKIIQRALRKYKFQSAGSLVDYVETHMDEFEEQDEEELEETPQEKNITIQPTLEPQVDVAIPNHMKQLSLREETELLYRQANCLKCLNEKRTVLLLPCSHFALCNKCEKTSSKCLVRGCNKVITDSIRTYVV